jgi:glycosyltransferase involved in cell wall biosynthesis
LALAGSLPRRLGLNLLYLVPGEVGGSEVYARNLVGAIRALEPQLEIVAYAGPEAVESLAAESWAHGMELVRSPVRSRAKPLRVGAELSWLPVRARRDGIDLLHSLGTTSPPVVGAASVVTVLDLIYRHYPETFPRASRLGLALVVPAGARRAERVIAISEAGRRDIVETLGLDPARIDVVHLGFGMADGAEPLTEAELRERHGLGEAQLVFTVSAGLRHKNLDRLLEAFELLSHGRKLRLVIVGHAGLEQDALRARARELGVAEQVRFTGWIDERELEGLYAAADVFAYPSLIEGFGMPVLEAMRRELPVACSNVSALPEVAGDAAELFDPYDSNAIAEAVARLLDDDARRTELVARGRRRVTEFTWERAARGTLAVYRRALAQRSSTRTAPQ